MKYTEKQAAIQGLSNPLIVACFIDSLKLTGCFPL